MTKNIIIAVETIIIIILIVILFNNGSNKTDANGTPKEDPNKALIGIYHNAQDKQTIRLEENNKCMYIDETKECIYSVENDIIKVHLTYYVVEADSDLTFVEFYNSLEKCNNALKTNDAYKTIVNPRCREQNITTYNYEVRIVDNGLLANNKVFNKIK